MLGEKLSREGGNVMMEIHTMRRCQQRLQLQVRISKRHLAVVSCLMSHASCLMSPVEVKVKITVKVKVEFEVEAILAICVASQLRTYERRSLVTGSCIVIGGT